MQCMQFLILDEFRHENHQFHKKGQNIIFGPPDPKMHESASHHDLAGKAQTAQQHPRDWSPVENADLLFPRVAEPL